MTIDAKYDISDAADRAVNDKLSTVDESLVKFEDKASISMRLDTAFEDRSINDIFRICVVDNNELVREISSSVVDEYKFTRASKSLASERANLLLAETVSIDSFK